MIVLFDFDGVVMDTETHYTKLWDEIGLKYLGKEGFGMTVKGQSLKLILGKYFSGEYEKLIPEVVSMVDNVEANLKYDYIAGAHEFMQEVHKSNVKSAIVTSSDDRKMNFVYKQRPELTGLVDYVVTADQFTHSKPHPECFEIAIKKFGGKPEDAVVLEDSIHGIEAGRAAGAFVIGVATTNPREKIEGITDYVIDDFTDFNLAKLESLMKNRK